MKLYYSIRSPYGRKVRVIAAHHEIALDAVEIATKPTPPELLAANPLAKVPALLLQNGALIADSQVIAEYLDAVGEKAKLLPEDAGARAALRTIEAICDGILEAGVAIVYEHLYRHEQHRSPEMIDKYSKQVARGVDWIAGQLPQFEHGFTLASVAVACTLDYLRHRLPDYEQPQGWTQSQPALVHWLNETLKNPAFLNTAPPEWVA